jgi:hypothetical protein
LQDNVFNEAHNGALRLWQKESLFGICCKECPTSPPWESKDRPHRGQSASLIEFGDIVVLSVLARHAKSHILDFRSTEVGNLGAAFPAMNWLPSLRLRSGRDFFWISFRCIAPMASSCAFHAEPHVAVKVWVHRVASMNT